MIRLDKSVFEKRGGFGCSNSDYELQAMTCCRKLVVWDDELDDIYLDPHDLTKAMHVWEQDSRPCPFCGATNWNIEELEPSADFPIEWDWARQK